jgi:DNA (cytosine-5)-methyltransferase 1
MYSNGMSEPQTLNIIDLFCGCGGFSLGATQAGFKSVLSVDIDPILSSAYKLNFPNTNLRNLDLANTSGEELLAAAKSQDITGIIGGPPCQGFSAMGRRDENDPRNELIGHFFKQVMHIRPKFFVMENVPGLLFGPMREKLEKQIAIVSDFYTIVGPVVVKASDLGAATSRQRVIVIGYDPNSFDVFTKGDIEAIRATQATVRDAISDLPPPLDSHISVGGADYGWRKFDLRKNPSPYALAARAMPPEGLGSPLARDKRALHLVSGLFNTVHDPKVSARYLDLEPGTSCKVSKSPKLKWEGFCPTLRAGTGSEKGSHQAVRPIHPTEGRVITVREAARLQGFPDWFMFHPAKWHSFRMIGNSVSPYLSFGLLNFIKGKMRGALRNAA